MQACAADRSSDPSAAGVLYRRRIVGLRTSRLRQKLRGQLPFSTARLVAVGRGFAAGRLKNLGAGRGIG